jgi:uncharacterized damage-inducible protein DinB
MNNNLELLKNQYEFIKASRDVVLNYCEKIAPEDYVKEVKGFGRGTICITQAHIGRSYIFWLSEFAMKKQVSYPPYDSYKNLNDVRKLFENVNEVVSEFLNLFENRMDENISGIVTQINKELTVPALQLFTHAITHEFHHKGQVMSMSRILGYTPPDADVIRFE